MVARRANMLFVVSTETPVLSYAGCSTQITTAIVDVRRFDGAHAAPCLVHVNILRFYGSEGIEELPNTARLSCNYS